MAPSRDRDEFAAFYRAHIDTVVRFAAKRTNQPQDVADIAAAVFVRALEIVDRYDPARGTARAWLLGICVNVQAEWHRRALREIAIQQQVAARARPMDDDIDRLETLIEATRLAPSLLDALESLPTNQRVMVELVALEGLTPTEAARALGITAGSARVRLSRGRAALRRAIDSGPHPHSSRQAVISQSTAPLSSQREADNGT